MTPTMRYTRSWHTVDCDQQLLTTYCPQNYVDPKSVRAVLARIVKYDKLPDGPMWASPIFIESLRGEGIVQLATGYTHCAAVSEGGDMYVQCCV